MQSRACRLLSLGLVAATWVAFCAGQTSAQFRDGLRRLEGKHIQIVTDLPPSQMVDELPVVFDLAVPQWCRFFGVSPEDTEQWKVTAYLVRNPAKFRSLGLLPDDLPAFLHGYQRDTRLWVYEQPGDYYLRHLLLHEGTHGFMHTMLGGSGAAWYNEGISELLGTHQWKNNQLTLGVIPKKTEETPYWGRIKIVRDECSAQRPKTLSEILRYKNEDFRRIEPYGWSWAACVFFHRHPQYQDRFHQLIGKVTQEQRQFSNNFGRTFRDDSAMLARDWQLFLENLDYGYDPAEESIHEKETLRELPTNDVTLQIDSAKGWQSSGILIRQGQTVLIKASGQFVIATDDSEWPCEPNGMSIEYHQGRPLGMLLGAVAPPSPQSKSSSGLLAPFAIGTSRTYTAEYDGTLFFRINEMAGRLNDNRGNIKINIKPTIPSDSPD